MALQGAFMFVEQRDGDGRGVGVTPVQRAAPDAGRGGDVFHRDGARVTSGEDVRGRGQDPGAVARGIGALGAGVVTAEQVRADVHHCTITHVRNKWTHCPVVCIINRTLCPL